MTRRLLLAAALLLAACNTNVDPQFRVKDVRVLAIRSGALGSDSADVAPGDTLVLDALVANPLGRPGLAIAWFGCLPTPNEAVSPCADLATIQDPSRLAGHPGVVALGQGPSIQLPLTGATEAALLPALDFALQTAKARPVYACRVYAELVVVVVASAQGHQSLAMKTVRVMPTAAQIAASGALDYYVLNLRPRALGLFHSPTIPDTCTGGISLQTVPLPAGTTVVCGTERSGSAQQYNICQPGSPLTVRPEAEGLSWQWYVTDGDFPDSGGVGNARGNDLKFVRPPEAFTIWGILRDGRGGDDWVSYVVSAL